MDQTNYTYQTYNLIAKQYVDKYYVDLTDVPYINLLLKDLPKGTKVLDAGCGAGQFTAYMQKQGFDALGIDMSDAMLDFARQKSPDAAFKKMDFTQMSFAPKSFGAILSAYSLIHVPEKEVVTTLKGFANALTDAGKVLIIAQKGESDHVVNEPYQLGGKLFLNFFTVDRLKNHLIQAGFNVVFVQEILTVKAYSLADHIIYMMGQKNLVVSTAATFTNPNSGEH